MKRDAITVVQKSLAKEGWRLAPAAAVATYDGYDEVGASAGVAIASPGHIVIAFAAGATTWDISPADSKGRAAMARVAMGRGLIAASIYLWTGEGLSDRNEGLLRHVLARLHKTGLP